MADTAPALERSLQASAAYLADAAGIDPPVVVTGAGAGLSIQTVGAGRDVITLPSYGYTAAVGVLAHEIAHLEAGDTTPPSAQVWRGVAVAGVVVTGWGAATAVIHTEGYALVGLMVALLGVALWWVSGLLADHATEVAADTRATRLIDEGLGGDGVAHTRAALDVGLAEPDQSWLDRLLVRHRLTHASKES